MGTKVATVRPSGTRLSNRTTKMPVLRPRAPKSMLPEQEKTWPRRSIRRPWESWLQTLNLLPNGSLRSSREAIYEVLDNEQRLHVSWTVETGKFRCCHAFI